MWKDGITVPSYLIQEVGDSGMFEKVTEDGTVDKDDLRIHLELSGGMFLLLSINSRMVMLENGDILLQYK